MLITQSDKITKKLADFSSDGLSKKITTDDRLIPFNDRVYELLSSVDNKQKNSSGKGLFALRSKLLEESNKDINTLLLDVHPWDMTDNTTKIFESFYNDMVQKMEDEKYSEYQNFITRAYEHCIRLATVLSLFDKKTTVTEREAMCAVGLMYYFIDQRMKLNIDGVIKTNDIVECAEKVHKFLEEKYPNSDVTKTILNNYGPNQYRKMELPQRDRVMEELKSRDIITLSEKDGKTMIRVTQL